MQLANVPKHNLHTVYSLFHPGAHVVNVPQKGWKIAMNANAVKVEGFMHELHSFEVAASVKYRSCRSAGPIKRRSKCKINVKLVADLGRSPFAQVANGFCEASARFLSLSLRLPI